MLRKTTVVAVLALVAGAGHLTAQATGQPSYNAPYRAFSRFEFGFGLSFPNYDQGPALEGVYRFASREFDVGFRAGVLFDGQEAFLAGVEGRYRVITHTINFPLDGALVFGGGVITDGGTQFQFPVGLSLGRRLDVEGSQVSVVPYVQPTLVLVNFENIFGNRETELDFAVGLGGDFRLSRAFDVRVSVGLGSPDAVPIDGLSISAVWLR